MLLIAMVFIGSWCLAAQQGFSANVKDGIIGLAIHISGIGFIISLVVMGIAANITRAEKITDTHIWLKGVHPDYLAELPPLPGPV